MSGQGSLAKFQNESSVCMVMLIFSALTILSTSKLLGSLGNSHLVLILITIVSYVITAWRVNSYAFNVYQCSKKSSKVTALTLIVFFILGSLAATVGM
jgi:Kef-type K+ transport system membrane component KefB